MTIGEVDGTGRTPRTGPRLVSGHRTPIRGRSTELALVDHLIGRLHRGSGSVLLIEGPPGIGKSRLLTEVIERAAAQGVRTAHGRAFEDQQTVPYAPLLDVFLRADPPIGDPVALRELALDENSGYWLMRDLQAAVLASVGSDALVVAVDDAHWADVGSVVAMRGLMTELTDVPVLWALSVRTGTPTAAIREAIDAITLDGNRFAEHVHLSAISEDAIADIARDVVRAEVDASLLALTGMAHGNPFLLLELLRGLDEEGRIHVTDGCASATGDRIPYRLSVTMDQRLDRLSADSRRAVQVASVLPADFSADLLARMLDRSPSSLVASIAEAVRVDLLIESGDRLRFRHDLLRHAARQSIPLTLRRAMERESATLMLEAGAAPEHVATQLVRSADIGDRDAVSTLRSAAESLSRSDLSSAADLSRRALDLLPPGDGSRETVLAQTVWLLNRASRFDEAQQLASAALAGDVTPEGEAQIRLSMCAVSTRGFGERAAESRRSLQLPHVSPQLRAQHTGWLAYNEMMDGQTADLRPTVAEAIGVATACGDPGIRILADLALASVDCAEGHVPRCLEPLAEVRRHVRTARIPVVGQLAVFHRANVMLTIGRLEDAADATSRGLDIARRGGELSLLHDFTALEALRAGAAGRLAEARVTLASLPGGIDYDGGGAAGLIHAMVAGDIAARSGDRDMLRTAANMARRMLDGGPAQRRAGLAALAHMAWQREDLSSAREWLWAATDLLGTPPLALDLDSVILAARVARVSGDPVIRERALSATAILGREASGAPLFWAVATFARGLLDRDPGRLEAAVDLLAECGRPLLHSAAIEEAGYEAERRGESGTAADRLTSAFDIYAACEAPSDARRVARALQRHGVQRRVVRPRSRTGWESLTESEWRVVELIADGASNREAAERLLVSPHTINTHLRNIYAKLGIRSRTDLARLARGERPGHGAGRNAATSVAGGVKSRQQGPRVRRSAED